MAVLKTTVPVTPPFNIICHKVMVIKEATQKILSYKISFVILITNPIYAPEPVLRATALDQSNTRKCLERERSIRTL